MPWSECTWTVDVLITLDGRLGVMGDGHLVLGLHEHSHMRLMSATDEWVGVTFAEALTPIALSRYSAVSILNLVCLL